AADVEDVALEAVAVEQANDVLLGPADLPGRGAVIDGVEEFAGDALAVAHRQSLRWDADAVFVYARTAQPQGQALQGGESPTRQRGGFVAPLAGASGFCSLPRVNRPSAGRALAPSAPCAATARRGAAPALWPSPPSAPPPPSRTPPASPRPGSPGTAR